jgi:RecG-like helicase
MTEQPLTPIRDVVHRRRVRVAGSVRSMRIQPWAGVATLECTIVDDTAGLTVVFLGRRKVAGIECGAHMVVEGMVGEHHGRLAILDPDYDLIA